MSALDAYHDLATFLWPCRKTRWMRGNYYLEKKRYHQAIADFEWIVKRFPDDFPAYDKIGDAALVIDDDTKAAHAHGEAFRINPKSDGSALLAGMCHARLNNHELAIPLLRKTIELKPKLALAHGWLAYSLHTQSSSKEALECILKAIEFNGKNARYFELRGDIFAEMKERSLAILDYQQAISIEATMLRYNRVGNLFFELKKFHEAIEAYTSAIAMESKCATLFHNRADAYFYSNQYAEYLADMERSVPYTEDAEKFNQYAWVMATIPIAELRNGTKAVRNALKACELSNYKNPNHVDTLAAAYATAGNFFKAVSLQAQAVELAPNKNKPNFQSRLDLYNANQPYINPNYDLEHS